MGIDIRCLPPHIQQQALQKMLAQNKTSSLTTKKQPKESKYHNTPTECKGIKFDSKKEATRYDELMIMLKAGKISDLRLQVNFTLQEGYTTPEGKRVKPIIYKADFTYIQEGKLMVEDVKSSVTKTNTYLMKKKMMLNKFGIEIKEV